MKASTETKKYTVVLEDTFSFALKKIDVEWVSSEAERFEKAITQKSIVLKEFKNAIRSLYTAKSITPIN